ncbi:MAG: hypothetical protein M5R36_03185 [Deltaproteobacteria bacterium]|nr:hypothetical protein [Deltaproteobacteria bacterium]
MRIILRALLLAALAAMLSFSASCSCGDDDDDSAADDDSGFDDDSSSDDDSAADDDTAESPATHEEFTIESGDLTLTVHFNPFGYRLTAPDKGIVTESYRYGEESHLFYYRDGKLFRLANFLAHEEDGEGGRTFYYMTTEGTRARVNIRFVSGKLLAHRFVPRRHRRFSLAGAARPAFRR